MSANMDVSLDEIIAKNPKTGRGGSRGGRRGSARKEILGKAPTNPATRTRAAASPSNGAAPSAPGANKIIVSNLPYDVNETQITELFTQTVGPIRNVSLTYDSNGKSKGVASVIFNRAADGAKAFQQYNNRLIDGKRAMKIELVVDPSRVAATNTLAARVSQPAADNNRNNGDNNGGRTRGTATRGRGRGRGGRKTNDRTPKTAADLDAEMEDYASSTAPAAPAAAAAPVTAA